MPTKPLTRLRKICLALPEAHEVEAWGEPTFRVRKKLFAMFASASTHGQGRPAVWCKAGPGNQEIMVRGAPAKFFVPPYVGPSGWIGVWLDGAVDWVELAELLRDSYGLVAPKRIREQQKPRQKLSRTHPLTRVPDTDNSDHTVLSPPPRREIHERR
jgi:predicted DNA-binding protein (MmcQ/YjbR family)